MYRTLVKMRLYGKLPGYAIAMMLLCHNYNCLRNTHIIDYDFPFPTKEEICLMP